ncbi:hypothetical protein [Hymenobacter negativus]|uniref:Lipoprotein n=1 Tax=Hymenobacter negativus TaxID=2795026 RepID=A0ABS0Q7U3_9BACT|nr:MULTISPECIES: hypothetical protein [Bacteria]MBH8558742.1 hypothetical protein [Hymenobacter negativus]MBH8570276.1 hypothetical protein [Hymenobacter negativus]MBR7210015.1 hypothetical protein [Microvirga sp. STS02]
MKPYPLVACLLFALSVASCETDEHIYISDKLKFGRVASEEFQYATDAACTNAATKYNKGDKPIPVSTAPLAYSFKDRRWLLGKKYEVRFITQPSVQPDGKKIPYFEIDGGSETDDASNAAIIGAAILELKQKGATIIQDTVLDSPINGKRAWRVVMHTDTPINDKDNKFTQVKDDFGMIINPPYPP